jgi:hypothetical protein
MYISKFHIKPLINCFENKEKSNNNVSEVIGSLRKPDNITNIEKSYPKVLFDTIIDGDVYKVEVIFSKKIINKEVSIEISANFHIEDKKITDLSNKNQQFSVTSKIFYSILKVISLLEDSFFKTNNIKFSAIKIVGVSREGKDNEKNNARLKLYSIYIKHILNKIGKKVNTIKHFIDYGDLGFYMEVEPFTKEDIKSIL